MTCEDWISAIDASMLTAIFLIRALVDGTSARGFGRIISITTGGVKSPGMYLQLGVSIGVRSGLTGFFGVLPRQVARHNVTQDASKRIGYARTWSSQQERGVRPRTRRFAYVAQFRRAALVIHKGCAFAAFLCSTHPGLSNGKNIFLEEGPTRR